MSLEIICGDALSELQKLPAESVQCCVTSPPYFGLRDYKHAAQLGREKTPEEYVGKLVAVFHEVRRVLKLNGTLWLNLADSYANDSKWGGSSGGKHVSELYGNSGVWRGKKSTGLKPKDLIGIPWMVAFALRADGWYLRRDIIWAKPNGMPESVTDRPVSSHEYVFLLSKSQRYFYNYEAVRLPALPSSISRLEQHVYAQLGSTRAHGQGKTNGAMKAVARKSDNALEKNEQQENGAALRSVWWISPAQTKDAHFAVMPANLAATCILAGSRSGDTVLDPFLGIGTTAMVAIELGRSAVGIELNPEYAAIAERRCHITPGLPL